MHEVRIPKDRVGVLIGKNGEVKKLIEKSTNTKIFVDKEGSIVIEGDGVGVYDANLIIKAVGRGFNPQIALSLLKDENSMEIINIKEFSGKSKNDLIRVRSRLIGKQGKARRMLEKLTGVDIVVYGKTVALVGEINNIDIAKQAVENLVRGSTHGNVYRFIQRIKE